MFILAFLLLNFPSVCQYYSLQKYTINEGLINNGIYYICQDSSGIIWINNGKGFSAFDGKKFKNFIRQTDISPENGAVQKGSFLYMNYPGGIARLNYFELKLFDIDKKLVKTYIAKKGAYRLNQFFIDKEAYSVIHKYATGPVTSDTIFYFRGNEHKMPVIFTLNNKDSFGLSLSVDNKGTIWLRAEEQKNAENKGLSLFYFDKGKLKLFMSGLPVFGFGNIFKSKNGDLYLAGKDSILKINRDKKITLLKFGYGYKTNYNHALAEDSKGQIWMGNYKGLIKINGEKTDFIPNPERKIIEYNRTIYNKNGEAQKIPVYDDQSYVENICIDAEDNIISGNEIFNGTSFRTLNLGGSRVSCSFIDKEGGIWLGTADGLFLARKVKVRALDLIGNICFVSNNGRQIFTYAGREKGDMFFLYNDFRLEDSLLLKSNTGSDIIDELFVQTPKRIILSACDQMFVVNNNRFTKLSINDPGKSSLKGDFVPYYNSPGKTALKGLYCDSKGYFWGMSSNVGCLFRTDGETVEYFGKDDGIDGTVSFGVEILKNQSIDYIFTSNGIYYLQQGKFHRIKGSEYQAEGIRPIGNLNGNFYFAGIHFGKTKEVRLYSLSTTGLKEYKNSSLSELPLGDNFLWYNPYKEGFLSYALNKGLTLLKLDAKNSVYETRYFICDPLYNAQAPSFHYSCNKIFVLDDAGPIQIYDMKGQKPDSLPIPVLIRDFSNFNDRSYSDSLGNIYATNLSGRSVMLNTGLRFYNDSIPQTTILRIEHSAGAVHSSFYNSDSTLTLPFQFNPLIIHYKAVTAIEGSKLIYRYRLAGMDENWNETGEDNIIYSSLPPGTYTFEIKACNNDGFWKKDPAQFVFSVAPPWYRHNIAYACYTLGALLIFFGFNNVRTRQLKKRAKELEQTVQERTAEIAAQKHVIEEKHKEITDSINYAQRIQTSFLATQQHLNANLNEYFVLFKPKDIVSGDFYWSASLSNGNFALATADSTGHGVPGAIMSLLNITSLEKAIESHCWPAEILNNTRINIIERLKKDGSAEGGKDGMDCSLIVMNGERTKLWVAAANNPVWIVSGRNVIEVKPDKMPVGKHDKQDIPFSQQEYDLYPGDVIFSLTDGFPDQFGGEKGKKFMSKNLREFLVKNSGLPMSDLQLKLEKTFKDWVGNLEQVDDVTVIGIRI